MVEEGIDIKDHPFFIKMNTEPGYYNKFIEELLSAVTKEINKSYEKDLKTGAKVIKLL